ncbi:MAG TPA: winged helix-turn-helix domain-containing protein [Acetobacteraceae bacterium]|nr:winged helix-turn-helix domain-containing protein [Acetobacteraceae bacterium]
MTSSGTAIPRQASETIALAAWEGGDRHEPPALSLAALSTPAGTARRSGAERLEFDQFTIIPDRRLLLRNGAPVRIGGRAFDLLVALVKRRGALVPQHELISEVWPSTLVEPGNLRVQIVALRKAIGDVDGRLIQTDAGRGYRFVAPLSRPTEAPPPPAKSAAAMAQLPTAVTQVIGRGAFIAELAAQLRHRRVITVVGPGGIGKTRVAAACTEAVAGEYRDGASFVDLTPATGLDSVVAQLAESLGIAAPAGELLDAVMLHLRNRQMLLTIDNCEHVVDAAAQIVETIAMGAPGVHILATSRESLRVLGEWVRILPPLPSPTDTAGITASEALTYPAVQLFVERATAMRHDFVLTDKEARLVAEICRRLDGGALAIELAAAKLHAFSLAWLAAHLDDPLPILNHGRRTAAARHQSLAATIDWSYDLLTDHERSTLQRVAALPGDFTIADAINAAAGDELGDGQVFCAVDGLVSKSLAMLDISGPVPRYRLPQTIRIYAYAKFARGRKKPMPHIDDGCDLD